MNASPTPCEYDAALAFLFGRIDFERQPAVPYRPGVFKLDRMRELLRRLDDPQSRQPIVHIAGTKGKGSTATMIASILSAAGVRAGLFTSPHLQRVEERFAVDGAACSADELIGLIEQIRPVVESMDRDARRSSATHHTGSTEPTFFEITTAMALLHFVRSEVDIVIFEVGMGGRLDSTNVCEPAVSVITSIGLDHTEQLGNTLALIAAEKAGIIKPGVPVVSGVVKKEPRDVIRRIASAQRSRLIELKTDFDFVYHLPGDHLPGDGNADRQRPTIDFKHLLSISKPDAQTSDRFTALPLSLIGKHQAANAAVAIATIEQLNRQGWAIGDTAVARGLAQTVCPARIEVLRQRPTVVVDAAHNVASIEALLQVLGESFSAGHRILVFAATRNKDFTRMLQLAAPQFERIILTRYENNPRGVPTDTLRQAIRSSDTRDVHICSDPSSAWQLAKSLSTADSLICITGSFFIAAEIRSMIVGLDNLAPLEKLLSQS